MRRDGTNQILNPFAAFRATVSQEDAADPAVLDELQRRFRHTILFATIGTIPTALGFGALMWFVAPSIGLVVWVVAALSTLGGWLWALRLPVEVAWLRTAVAIQIYGGIVWGSLPVVAMPADQTWQLFLAAFGMGVQASCVLFAAQIRRLFYAFHGPNAVLSFCGFMLFADGAGRWGAALLGYAAFFAIGLSEIHHLTALSASTFSIKASRLADGLATKSEALAEANERLAEQARTDPLTALANRFDFDQQLIDALARHGGRTDRVVAVAMVDLDDFKVVNDSFGHRAGDLLLVAVGERLGNRLGPGELLARFGGDELVVLSPSLRPGSGLVELGQRLASAFDDTFSIDGRLLEVGASIGIADSSSSVDASDLLRFADTALYLGKREGGGRVQIFDTALDERLKDRRQLEVDLTAALGQGHLSPYLQPFVDVGTGRIVGGESLVRWVRPEGVKEARLFFPVIAELGLEDELTDRLLDDLTAYRYATATPPPVPISVNVAPDRLAGLLDRVEGTDLLTGLTLEITEQTAFDNDPASVNRLVTRAHRAGARVLLDDFGVGFSSLARATKLDVDGYKIDRLFVADLTSCGDARAVVAGIVEIARRQGRELIAEGVETTEQAVALAELGVATMQGFLYAPAVPLDQFDRWLATGHRFRAVAATCPTPLS